MFYLQAFARATADHMWIIYGPYDKPFTKWPVLAVDDRSARLFCPGEKLPKLPLAPCTKDEDLNMNSAPMDVATIVLAPESYPDGKGGYAGKSVSYEPLDSTYVNKCASQMHFKGSQERCFDNPS